MDATQPSRVVDFNPRPPRGGRQTAARLHRYGQKFQSAPPARGATNVHIIHAAGVLQFQSAPPARGATLSMSSLV